MLSKRQLEKVKEAFHNVTENTMLLSLGRMGNTQVYKEVSAPYRWRIVYKDNTIVGIHRDKDPTPA